MRALQVNRHGEPRDVLSVNDVEPPAPGDLADGEVLTRVAAGALNFNDILRQGGPDALIQSLKDKNDALSGGKQHASN